MRQLKDILRDRPLFSVAQAQTVVEAARIMAALNVGAILVLENGELRGIFTERDLMTRVVAQGLDPARAAVGEVMTGSVTTIPETATPDEAMDLMYRHKCRHLPVLRDTRVLGMVSMRDLMTDELERRTEELKHMRAYIHGNP